jgi:hypothetical protein
MFLPNYADFGNLSKKVIISVAACLVGTLFYFLGQHSGGDDSECLFAGRPVEYQKWVDYIANDAPTTIAKNHELCLRAFASNQEKHTSICDPLTILYFQTNTSILALFIYARTSHEFRQSIKVAKEHRDKLEVQEKGFENEIKRRMESSTSPPPSK